MDKQTIADELASLAGWTLGPLRDPSGNRSESHPYPVGSLDALEAFRRERLPGVMLSYLHDYSDTNPEADPRFRCEASIVRMTDGRPDGCWIKSGRTMWSSYASALIAAAKESAPASPDASAPSRSDSPSSSPSCGEPSTDSARRALADEANWPKWLTREAASTLPEGVERVWGRRGDQLWCYPGMHYWGATTGWDICSWSESHMGDGMFKNQQVYHLPPAAKGEGDAWSRWGAAHHPDMWTRERFNAFVAGESQAKYQQGFKDGEAVAEHKHRELENAVNYLASLPKPDAGRAEGVKPKPSPGEVAEDDLIEGAWSLLANVGSLGGGWASQGSVWQMAAQSWRDKYTKRAAIVRERSAP